MRLYEFEGKHLLAKYGITVPRSVLFQQGKAIPFAKAVVKAQTQVGGRGKAGLVKLCSVEDAPAIAQEMMGKTHKQEIVQSVLIEERLQIDKEFYLGMTYDTDSRSAVLMLSHEGGIEVERADRKVHTQPLAGTSLPDINEFLRKAQIHKDTQEWTTLIERIAKAFFDEDMRLLEINPLVSSPQGLIAADCKIELEDEAGFRHKERLFPPRQAGFGRPLTPREQRIKEVNAQDYRGTVKFLELEGDIGFLAAGGGGSITCMDALMIQGGKPANFTEYSGNPSDEKVYELSKAIISKPGLKGLWIVGAVANFTLMDTTMAGVIRALEELKPTFPIVVRRSGPKEREGIAMLQDAKHRLQLDMEIYGAEQPMTATAAIIVRKAEAYGHSHR